MRPHPRHPGRTLRGSLSPSQFRQRIGVVLKNSLLAATCVAAASWPLVRAYVAFGGTSRASGALTWISVAAVLPSLPLTVAWTRNRTAAAWGIPVALACGVLPPLGLVGWASPVTSAGVLFPGTARLSRSAGIIGEIAYAGKPTSMGMVLRGRGAMIRFLISLKGSRAS